MSCNLGGKSTIPLVSLLDENAYLMGVSPIGIGVYGFTQLPTYSA